MGNAVQTIEWMLGNVRYLSTLNNEALKPKYDEELQIILTSFYFPEE